MMTKENLNAWLNENANAKVAGFAVSLVPGLRHKMYGIRLPMLRKKAKELVGEIDNIKGDSCEEILLKAYAIGYIKDIDLQLRYVKKFVPLIDNWMFCDSFCSALVLAKKHQEVYWRIIREYTQSSKDYEQRFAYVMMLKYFCNQDYIHQVLNILKSAKPKIWDTKQALAWALAECFIKFQEITRPILAELSQEIFKLTKRKILDSKRVDENIKQMLKSGNLVRPV